MGTQRPRHLGTLGICAVLAAGLLVVAPAFGAPTVRLSLWGGFPEIGPFYERLAADYRRANPTVEITILTHVLRDFERKLAATIPADGAADIIEISTYAMQRFIEAGFIPPNPPAQDALVRSKSFPDAMRIINTYRRQTFGVPFFQGRQVLFWNIRMFQEAGLTRAPQNWDEVIEYCQKVTKRDAAGKLTRGGSGSGSSAVAAGWARSGGSGSILRAGPSSRRGPVGSIGLATTTAPATTHYGFTSTLSTSTGATIPRSSATRRRSPWSSRPCSPASPG